MHDSPRPSEKSFHKGPARSHVCPPRVTSAPVPLVACVDKAQLIYGPHRQGNLEPSCRRTDFLGMPHASVPSYTYQ